MTASHPPRRAESAATTAVPDDVPPTAVPDVVPLETTTRNYAWGSPTVIPGLLGEEPTGAPVAELWIGAHPDSPSRRADHPERMALDELVATDPAGLLGDATADRFGARLPFLVKLLAAHTPLSLQAHPDRDQARAGFAREQAAGVPADAPQRIYRDDNHKPEMICALSRFEGLCGFRDRMVTVRYLRALGAPELDDLVAAVEGGADLRPAVELLLGLDEVTVRRWVHAAAGAVDRYVRADPAAEFAAEARWTARLAAGWPGDAGSART